MAIVFSIRRTVRAPYQSQVHTSRDARTEHRTKHRTRHRTSTVRTPYATYGAPPSGISHNYNWKMRFSVLFSTAKRTPAPRVLLARFAAPLHSLFTCKEHSRAQQRHSTPQRAQSQAAPRADKFLAYSTSTARGNGLRHTQSRAQQAPRAQQQHRTWQRA